MDFEQRFSKVGRYLESDFFANQESMNREWVSEEDIEFQNY